MKVLVCPDKFKGSLTVDQVCDAMRTGIHRFSSQIEVQTIALADGGEGSLDILAGLKDAQCISIEVFDPLFRPVVANYVLHGSVAYIEMAQASGLLLLKPEERNPMYTSTFGTGELIKNAIERGATHIFVMIGGSATNDGGCGMAEALGVKFHNQVGRQLTNLCGKDLQNVYHIDFSALDQFKEIKFTILSDVANPLLGKEGASLVYAPQKGADLEESVNLDQGLQQLTSVMKNGKEKVSGAGAAGGLGYGLMSFFDAEIKSGIDEIIRLTNFEAQMKTSDFVLTGEGKLDDQTLSGKLIDGVARVVRKNNIPFAIICGICSEVDTLQKSLGAETIMAIADRAPSLEHAMAEAAQYVEQLSYETIQRCVEKYSR